MTGRWASQAAPGNDGQGQPDDSARQGVSGGGNLAECLIEQRKPRLDNPVRKIMNVGVGGPASVHRAVEAQHGRLQRPVRQSDGSDEAGGCRERKQLRRPSRPRPCCRGYRPLHHDAGALKPGQGVGDRATWQTGQPRQLTAAQFAVLAKYREQLTVTRAQRRRVSHIYNVTNPERLMPETG